MTVRVIVGFLGIVLLAGCAFGSRNTDPDDADASARTAIAIDLGGTRRRIDPHVFGTNVPAWIGPDRLADPAFRRDVVASGATLLRMPGGSWSNDYDWLGCELVDASRCFATWAARPSDFVDLLHDTQLDGMWTVAFNGTAQSAAAAVAFFNGEVGDMTPLGTDRSGMDWETVDTWAKLRGAGGHPEPVGIRYWEIGNEVFGARPDTGGSSCPDFGWEHVWTCNGREYVEGDDEHDGLLDFRQAMRSVDDDILVGAVGVADPSAWGNWSADVLDASGAAFDFFILHDYGFSSSPTAEDALQRPSDAWPDLIEATRELLPAGMPIAVTEYNLVSFEGGDTRRSMTTALNALFIADTIGQLVESGVQVANQWNVANGTTESGTDYGMISLDDGRRLPQFYALAAWADAGEYIHEAPATPTGLRIYPTSDGDGRVVLIAMNVTEQPRTHTLAFRGLSVGMSGTLRSVAATDHTSTQMVTAPPATIEIAGERLEVTLAPWSINVIDIGTGDV